jgi:hypothetical protein
MKNNHSSNGTARVTFRTNAEIKKQIKRYAQDENISENAVIQLSLQKFFTSDVSDESLLIAKMTRLDGVLNKLNNKSDLFHKLLLDFFQYNFLFFPSLPEDTKQLKIKYSAAAKSFRQFMAMFRKRLKAMPSLEETIYGDLLEAQANSKPLDKEA